MAISDADLWHQVHAQREDGVAAMFLIREVEPRPDQPQIFVIEMPYSITDPSKLPDEAGHHRLETFQEQWIKPACETLGWTFVAWKSEDGSFFLYLYGDGDPNALLEKLAPFDSALGFFNDRDDDWSEYAALRELVDQAQTAPEAHDHVHEGCEHEHEHEHNHEHEHEHEHDHDHDHDHEHDHDAMSNGISVIDLTGEPPARESEAKPAKANTARAKPAKAKPAKANASRAKAAKANASRAKAAKAKATAKTPPVKAAKAKATARTPPPKAAKAKAANAKAMSKATASKATTKRASTTPLAKRSAAKKPTASKSASRPAASKPSKPRASRR